MKHVVFKLKDFIKELYLAIDLRNNEDQVKELLDKFESFYNKQDNEIKDDVRHYVYSNSFVMADSKLRNLFTKIFDI